uniref:Uncharacterized protein n=1 Tax=Cacopsylla melanoneura TaxID=428564 RepID=A0A8D8TY53_9HEMI
MYPLLKEVLSRGMGLNVDNVDMGKWASIQLVVPSHLTYILSSIYCKARLGLQGVRGDAGVYKVHLGTGAYIDLEWGLQFTHLLYCNIALCLLFYFIVCPLQFM